MGINALLTSTLFTLLLGFVDSEALPFFLLHSFDFSFFRLVQISIMILLSLHKTKFFFFKNFHPCAFKRFSTNYTQKWFNFIVKDEKFVIFNQRFLRNASQLRHAMGSGRTFNFEGCLATNFVNWCLIGKFRDKLVSLDVNILFARGSFRCFHITREKLFCSFCTLLLHCFGVVLGLVGVKQFVGVSTGWDHHGCVSATTVHTLIVHDVMGSVVLSVYVTVWVLILRFCLNNSWSGSETLGTGTCSASIWLL